MAKTNKEIAKEVLEGKWGSGTERKKKLIKAGYDYNAIQKEVTILVKEIEKKAIDKIAQEVIAGKWGSGATREKKLKAAGYNPKTIQKRVNELLALQEQKKKYQGKIPSIHLTKNTQDVINDTIKWALWVAKDNDFHYGYTSKDKKINAHHNGCYFCGTNKNQKKGMLMPEHTYCCNPFVNAAWAHGGCIPTALKLCRNSKSWSYDKGSGYDVSPLFKKLGHPKKSSLTAGDVLCRSGHIALYIGNGKIVQAACGDDNKKNSIRWDRSISVTNLTDTNYKNFSRIYRFIGSVNTIMNITHGEVSKRVQQWQQFLNWYFDDKLGTADGCFGDKTLKWTKKFQEIALGKGEGDGIVGSKTLEAAKKIQK